MIDINIQDFIYKGIKNKDLLILKWILGLFTVISAEAYEDEYYKKDKNEFYIKLDDEYILITNKYTEPIVKFNDIMEIDNTILPNVTNKIKTTVGRVVLNTILNTYCFNNKIPFINKEFTLDDIESKIEDIGLINDTDYKEGSLYIKVSEFKEYLDISVYIDTFTNYLSLGVTEYSIKQAPGMKSFIKETISELEKKYKESPLSNPKAIAELESKIIEYDTNYLKQDPSYGKIITKKVVNMARKRMYGVYGIGGDVQGRNNPILIALIDGLGKDPKIISMLFNDLISGVAGRGDETKDAGVTTKEAIRATSTTVLSNTFCNTKIPIITMIDDIDTYIGRYIRENGKQIILTKDNISKYMNKQVPMYDIMTCISETGGCIVCAGESFIGYEKTIPLLTTDLGGMLLKNKLKKFHQTELKIVTLDLSYIL